MEYVPGGDLMWHIQRRQFGRTQATFYAAEVLLALEYFHTQGIVYRSVSQTLCVLSAQADQQHILI